MQPTFRDYLAVYTLVAAVLLPFALLGYLFGAS